MIDNIHLYRLVVLDTNRFSNEFYQIPCGYYTDVWNIYKYNKNGVTFSYSTRTHRLKIEGRLYTLCHTNNLVGVLGELWAGVSYDSEHQDLDDILDIVNSILHDLTGYRLNIRTFKVSYIEICFNLTTPHVNDYIKLLNHKFLSGRKRQYKSFVNEQDKQPYTSFYIKTGTDYKNNTKSNYVVNFYNKIDQLKHMRYTNKGYEYKKQVAEKDLELAENILRLELQCGYQFLRNLRIERNITMFVDFLDMDLCAELIEEKYKFFIDTYGQLDFHTYKSAISICSASGLSKQDINKLCDYCLALSKGYSHTRYKADSTRKRYNDKLADLELHSFLILPRYDISVTTLTSPITLLRDHVNNKKASRKAFIEQFGIVNREPFIEDDVQEYEDVVDIDDLFIAYDDIEG